MVWCVVEFMCRVCAWDVVECMCGVWRGVWCVVDCGVSYIWCSVVNWVVK